MKQCHRIATAAVFVAAVTCAAQSPLNSRPAAERRGGAGDVHTSSPADSGAAPSDAERVARLQRSIDESTREVEALTAGLNDPKSDFAQAELAFTELDAQLAELKKQTDLAGDSDESRRTELQKELSELEAKHKLAKDRFDLAIRERKTVQEQIKTLQQKIAQDGEALSKLKGDNPSASQPATAAPPIVVDEAPATSGPSADGPTPAGSSSEPPGSAATPLAAPAGGPGVASPPGGAGAAAAKPPPEVIEAREEAAAKEAEAQSAQAEVDSVTERMNALQKNVELERQLVSTGRKKVENAQATERTLYEELQKKWQEGASQGDMAALREQIGSARERLREAQAEMRDRTDRLERYRSELVDLQAEHIAAMEEAQKREAEAQRAQKRVAELESPLSPRNLKRWLLERGPKVGAIIAGMVVLLWLSRIAGGRIVTFIIGRGQGGAEDRVNRAHTLVGVFHSAATVAVYAGGGMMILTEVGVNIIPLMGGAAVFGLAVAFGAQNLIRDYFYGFMILLENQYTVNDVVKIGDVGGQVERITLRVTTLRDLDGTVHFVPNGEITRVSNMTHEWSRALFDIPVAYKEDVDRVMNELVELAKELRRDPEFRGLILEMPEMLGVDEFADSAIIIRFLIKTKPLKQWTVKRELLRRIKKRFDELGIEIPFPHRTLYHRHEPNGAGREGGERVFAEPEMRA